MVAHNTRHTFMDLTAKEVRAAIEARLQGEVATLAQRGITPGLAVLRVGDNPESAAYVGRKVKLAGELGIVSRNIQLPEQTTQEALEAEIAALNADSAIHGILCQLPLPAHISESRITTLIDPAKDVDCFHPANFGLLAQGIPRFLPCTPAGIVEMLRHYDIATSGAHVVILGRSNIVGRPLALMLGHKGLDATVTVCHSRTPDLAAQAARADILVAAIGRPEWVGPEMVKEGAVVIDVGINRVDDPSRPRGYRLCGDVDYQAVAPRARAITPVPGGVGPLTVTMLMQNTLTAAGIAR